MSAAESIKSKARAKERAEEQIELLDDEQATAIRMLANEIHRLNQTVVRAVEAGVCVELVRTARHHSSSGQWGDLVVPVIKQSLASGDSQDSGTSGHKK